MFTKLDYRRKMSETDTHVYFVGGPFSQWAKSPFSTLLAGVKRHVEFGCCEQYMMARKAILFGDMMAFEEILKSTNPSDQKAIGRRVQNFDLDIWNQNAREIVYEGNMLKFDQNPEMWEELDATGDKHIVEGAHYDSVWGVKLAWNDPLILDPANWRGTNWLGEVLMQVRADIRAEKQQCI